MAASGGAAASGVSPRAAPQQIHPDCRLTKRWLPPLGVLKLLTDCES